MAILFVFSSCQKEENSNPQEEKVHVSTSLDTRSFNGDITHPFYQTEYVKNELQINLPRVVSTARIYDLMNEIHELSYQDNLVATLENRNYFPCWSCGEADYSEQNDMIITIVPIVDITNSKLISLMVREEIQEIVSIKYVDVELLKLTETQNLDVPNNYYQRIVTYFEKLIINESVNWFEYRSYQNDVCMQRPGGNCICDRSGYPCDIPGNNIWNCGDCGGTGSTNDSVNDGGATDGGTPNPPPTPIDWNWVVFLNTYGPNFIDPGFPPLGGGGANGTNTTQNDFEDIFKVLETIHGLINYIKVDRQLPLSQATIDILKDFDYFQLLTIPLDGTKENLTDDQILAFLEFITNHPNFIESEEESLYLQFDNVFTGLLNDYLLENNSNKAKEIAHAALQGYTTGSFTSGYREVIANMKDLLQLISNNISLQFTTEEKIWIINNKDVALALLQIQENYANDAEASAASQIYVSLGQAKLLDKSPAEVIALLDYRKFIVICKIMDYQAEWPYQTYLGLVYSGFKLMMMEDYHLTG